MKKRVLAALIVGLTVVFLAAAGYAAKAVHDPDIQKRFDTQQKRIDAGVASGQLTKQEAALVQDNLNRIMAAEAKMKADGKLTPKDRSILEQKLNQNSLMISRERNNAIRRID